jgi:hypothetical protein
VDPSWIEASSRQGEDATTAGNEANRAQDTFRLKADAAGVALGELNNRPRPSQSPEMGVAPGPRALARNARPALL